MTSLLHTFVGGTIGTWRVERIQAITGSTQPLVPQLSVDLRRQSGRNPGEEYLASAWCDQLRTLPSQDGAVRISGPTS